VCGIVGIADPTGKAVDEQALRKMCAAIEHRGPDGEGYYANIGADYRNRPAGTGSPEAVPASSVGLGMRRLAVIDLETGQQPIHNEDKTIWVVLNGEIYNYPELRAEMEAAGHSFYTKTDTEAIVHAYEKYGTDLPKRLRGMFAFALWDARKNRLLLARDRVGKKPLLYTVAAGKLIFASEFQALLAHPDISREVNLEALPHYLSFMCVPGPMTAFRGVQKLDPGCLLIWQDGEVSIERYWSLNFASKTNISEDEAAERSIQLLQDAVRVRLMSDVPLGAFLSGGIDSSAVVALMCQQSTSRVKTFSIGFGERDFSEIAHARRVAERFGTDHHEFIVRPDAIEVLPQLVRHYGEPYADSSAIPTYYLSKMTRQHVTVALNGDGGDECFGGYERYVAMRIAERYNRLPAFLKRRAVEPVIAAMPQAGATRSRMARARRFLSVMGRPSAERYLRWTSVFSEELKQQLCAPGFLQVAGPGSSLSYVTPWFAGNGEIDVVDKALTADTAAYLPNDLLVKVDIASMAVSLEARSPFLDHHLMEFAASLPANMKVRGLTTKYILKQALKGLLPQENLNRSKMGFGVPIGHWLRGELKDFAASIILSDRAMGRGYFRPPALHDLFESHAQGRRDHAHQLWTLLMLELWHRELID
jgi:asparagine synthase (glutamine-hydrolysing)